MMAAQVAPSEPTTEAPTTTTPKSPEPLSQVTAIFADTTSQEIVLPVIKTDWCYKNTS